MTSTVAQDPLRPQPPGGLGRGATLALLVHAGLLVALALGLNWRASEPAGVSAELWSAVPQQAAPKAEAAPTPEPPKPQPQPKVEPPPHPPKPRAEPAPQADAQIAIEKARREKAEKERAEREKAERAEREKAQREQAEREQAAREKREALEAQKKKEAEEKRQAERVAKLREENLRRIQGLAGATGAPTSAGAAQRDAGPSASYAGRIVATIRPNIIFGDELASNPRAEVEVRAAPDGSIIGRRIVKSSGHADWDDAVLRAIDRTRALPRDADGRVPSPIVLGFRPRE